VNVFVTLWRRLIQFGFRLLYNELAFTYDGVSRFVSLGQWKCWQRSVFEFIGEQPTRPILEIAHGTGDLQLDLQARGLNAIGVDLSPRMGAIAQHKLKRADIRPQLARCQAQQLPFADGQFEVVLCTFPTPFIFEAATLREVRRVLRDDGQAVIVLNGMFTARGPHVQVLELLYRITGQRGGRDTTQSAAIYRPIVERMAMHGFQARMERVPCPYSEAQVIVAQAVSKDLG
jgi:ubiquinone/menaquinone biosynthesis C-methylase UbiE